MGRTARRITEHTCHSVAGFSLWGPGYLFSLWIPDWKTDSDSQTEQELKAFYWGTCLWPLTHKFLLFFIILVYYSKQYPGWLPIYFTLWMPDSTNHQHNALWIRPPWLPLSSVGHYEDYDSWLHAVVECCHLVPSASGTHHISVAIRQSSPVIMLLPSVLACRGEPRLIFSVLLVLL